jgi:hypothetical protein
VANYLLAAVDHAYVQAIYHTKPGCDLGTHVRRFYIFKSCFRNCAHLRKCISRNCSYSTEIWTLTSEANPPAKIETVNLQTELELDS